MADVAVERARALEAFRQQAVLLIHARVELLGHLGEGGHRRVAGHVFADEAGAVGEAVGKAAARRQQQ